VHVGNPRSPASKSHINILTIVLCNTKTSRILSSHGSDFVGLHRYKYVKIIYRKRSVNKKNFLLCIIIIIIILRERKKPYVYILRSIRLHRPLPLEKKRKTLPAMTNRFDSVNNVPVILLHVYTYYIRII